MSILTKVEAKSRKGRLFQLGVLIALIVGGITMIYPFLLMLSGAMRSDMDISEMDLIPNYMTNDKVLIRKFMESKYDYDAILLNRFNQTRDYSFKLASIPKKINQQEVSDFKQFLKDNPLPNHWQILGGIKLYKVTPSHNYNLLLENIRKRYNDDLQKYNQDIGTPMLGWDMFSLNMPEWAEFRYAYKESPVFEEYFKLIKESPVAELAFVNLTGSFLENVIYPEYSITDVKTYNKRHKKTIKSYEKFAISRTVPPKTQPQTRKDWLNYVYENCNMSFVRTKATDRQYRKFLRNKYGKIGELNNVWNTKYKSFNSIKLPKDYSWVTSNQQLDYREFLKQLKPESLYLIGPEFAWQDMLKNKYGSIAALNKAYGTNYTSWEECKMPLKQIEAQYVLDNSTGLRWRYAIKNFSIVCNAIFIQGRSFVNTVIYVILALLFSLILQPLVAYALSRYNPPGTWKFILIFMATMAFPPMVAFIPQFLIIKNLNLLNTFFALVLPVTINGYLIFLLKGFFDSIPHDLYDAAMIDGASEMRMFLQITMALSKPMLAVVALNTFRMAWMSFMYPLIVCPDEKMHVLAVWLHQFQKQAPTSAVFASIMVASIPTLLIFIFTQRTIMRGIAVPSEK